MESGDTSLYFILLSLLLLVIILLSKKLHESPRWNAIVSEASLVLILGSTAGAFVHFFILQDATYPNDQKEDEYPHNYALALSLLNFDPTYFFYALLPPIMFTSGFELRRELFYRHIKPIAMFACIGTTLAALATGGLLILTKPWFGTGFAPSAMELLTFGALISATDAVSVLAVLQQKQVDPHLFSLVFGESALNDAVALILFNVFSHFVLTQYNDSASVFHQAMWFFVEFLATALLSPILGMVIGVVVALIFKHFDLREYPKFELAIYSMLMYIPFLIAEECSLSGIIAIFFTGMSACRYVSPNVSIDTQRNVEAVFRLASYAAETAIFLELGLSLFGLKGSFPWAFIGLAIVASLLGRALSIYPLAYLYNWSLREVPKSPELLDDASSCSTSSSSLRRRTPYKRKDQKISVAMTHMVWFAGLRGAVAYACARDFPNVNGHNDEFTAATMIIVLFTIVGMGGSTTLLLDLLGIEVNVDEELYMEHWHQERELKGPFHAFEQRFIYNLAVRSDDVTSSEKDGKEMDECTNVA